uniref:Uncharacterized protein n=1 Tax=Plectus sambesii TaxID=2011161 RepID=A0A914W0G9_9BILA
MGTQLTSRVVVITGAGSGIGAAIAIKFVEESEPQTGLRLVITDRNGETLARTVETCLSGGRLIKENLVSVVGDITEAGTREELVKATLTGFGKLDVLVNCAGILIPGSSVPGADPKDADLMMETNVKSVYQLVLAFRESLIKSKGAIVNLSSVCAFKPSTNRLFYCMSKAALEQVTRCMALEYAKFGVRVNSVAPGVIHTDIHSHRDTYESTKVSGVNEYYDAQAAQNPMKRNGTPSEVADAVFFLASSKASFINGHSLVVDGGLSFAGPLLD